MKSFSGIFRTKSTDSAASKTQPQSQSPTNRKSTSMPPSRASENGQATQGRKRTPSRAASTVVSVAAPSVVGSTISAASTSNKESNLAKINALTGPEKAALEKKKQVLFKMAPRNEVLVKKGDPVTSLYVIIKGLVMVFRSGDEYADYSVGPGDIFGDEVFSTQISMKTYKTMFEVYYCVVSKDAFMKLDIFSPFRGMIGSERMPENISVVEGAIPNTKQDEDTMSNIFFSFLGGSSSEEADNRSVYSFNPDKTDVSEDHGVAPSAAATNRHPNGHGHRAQAKPTKTKNCDDPWCFMDWGMLGLR